MLILIFISGLFLVVGAQEVFVPCINHAGCSNTREQYSWYLANQENRLRYEEFGGCNCNFSSSHCEMEANVCPEIDCADNYPDSMKKESQLCIFCGDKCHVPAEEFYSIYMKKPTEDPEIPEPEPEPQEKPEIPEPKPEPKPQPGPV